MPQSELLIRILVTVVLGSILGLETETREIEKKGKEKAISEEKSRLGGLRTYTILSLFGGVAGIFYLENLNGIIYLMLGGIIVLILSAYILNVRLKNAFGLTTEVAVLMTFLLGFLTTSNIISIEIVLVILVLLSFFLSQKRGFGSLINKIQHKELIDVIKFGLITIVLLPLIPNREFLVSDLFDFLSLNSNISINRDILDISLINPFKMWIIVILISGLDLLGYILSKFIGAKRGIYLAGFVGGLVSSTSTLISLAHKSKNEKNKGKTSLLAASALASNSASYIDTSIILLVGSLALFNLMIVPFLVMLVIGILISLSYIYSNSKDKVSGSSFTLDYKPFSIVPALKFVIIIIGIKIFVQLIQLLNLGNSVMLVTAISGIVGFDPVVLAMADLYEEGTVSLKLAAITLVIANLLNFFAKITYSYIGGNKLFLKKVFQGLFFVGIGSLVVIFFI
jgi:uncharacterized membrane protein (DUF4010 family)